MPLLITLWGEPLVQALFWSTVTIGFYVAALGRARLFRPFRPAVP